MLQKKSAFSGFEVISRQFENRSFTCEDCPNACEIVILKEEDDIKALWGSRCGKWTPATVKKRWKEKEHNPQEPLQIEEEESLVKG